MEKTEDIHMSDRDEAFMKLVQMMAHDKKTVENAAYYLDGPGRGATDKEKRIKLIDLLLQDGSAMGFDDNDDVGDIVWCLDDISEYYHLMISESWFSDEDGLLGWFRTLSERWGRNGVAVLCIEDPKGRMYPIYAVEYTAVPAILEQAKKADIPICRVEDLKESDEKEEPPIDFSME